MCFWAPPASAFALRVTSENPEIVQRLVSELEPHAQTGLEEGNPPLERVIQQAADEHLPFDRLPTEEELLKFLESLRATLAPSYGFNPLLHEPEVELYFSESGWHRLEAQLQFPEGRQELAWDCFEASFILARLLAHRYQLSPRLVRGQAVSHLPIGMDVVVEIELNNQTYRLSLTPTMDPLHAQIREEQRVPWQDRISIYYSRGEEVSIGLSTPTGVSTVPMAWKPDGENVLYRGGVGLFQDTYLMYEVTAYDVETGELLGGATILFDPERRTEMLQLAQRLREKVHNEDDLGRAWQALVGESGQIHAMPNQQLLTLFIDLLNIPFEFERIDYTGLEEAMIIEKSKQLKAKQIDQAA